jgi:hypothetical protein
MTQLDGFGDDLMLEKGVDPIKVKQISEERRKKAWANQALHGRVRRTAAYECSRPRH